MNLEFKSGYKQFLYSGNQKYIKLIQKCPDDNQSIQRCFLLDSELSIIQRQMEKDIDLEKQREINQLRVDKILYFIEEQPKQWLFKKGYQKYYQVYDFLIGRENWGRTINSMKIQSDSVSRDHTKLAINISILSKDLLLKIMKQNIQKARRASRWRKIPHSLLQKIIEYSVDFPFYSIQDCGSRNGTFLLDYELTQNEVKLQESYQFSHQNYVIQIHQMKKSTGQQLDTLLSELSERFQVNRRLNHQRSEILPSDITRQQLKSNIANFNWISLEFYVNHQFKFFYQIINKDENVQYPIGQGQLLNVGSSVDQVNINRHGTLKFLNGKWFISSSKNNQRVWTKLQPRKKYLLNKTKYKIMIAHHSVLEMEFHNFE